MLDRRRFIRTSAQLTLLAPSLRLVHAATPQDARFIMVILRGGLDGLAAVAPYGEPRYAELRGELALGKPGSGDGALKLDGLFGLHPALENMHALYQAGALNVVHAVATPYRERSHFDGQKVLEAGLISPSTSAGGWLNRALTAIAAIDTPRDGIALAANVPLALRGPYQVSSWSPSRLPNTDEDTLQRILSVYEASDAMLAERLEDALNAQALAGSADAGERMGGGRGGQALSPLTSAAARFVREPDGPRIAVIDASGWDTHANQGAANGGLSLRLRALDQGLKSLQDELGSTWDSTTVMIVTEFGRTVAVNGTRGTDHGTASCAFVAGGTLNGGHVITDWPGLGAADLHEGRDLRPTLDLRAAFKSVLHTQYGLTEAQLETDVFPDSANIAPLDDLI
jgi:uncharacterized protein (DUF1501 family)